MIVKDLAYERLVIKDQVTQIAALTAQRDELLAALKDILRFIAPPISGSSARRLACVRARAAIANCKTTYQVMEAAER